jgi:hypothetical protein
MFLIYLHVGKSNKLYKLYYLTFFRCAAKSVANKYISPQGIQKILEQRLKHNELFRYQIFKGKFKEEFTNDKLQAAEQRILASYNAGLV